MKEREARRYRVNRQQFAAEYGSNCSQCGDGITEVHQDASNKYEVELADDLG